MSSASNKGQNISRKTGRIVGGSCWVSLSLWHFQARITVGRSIRSSSIRLSPKSQLLYTAQIHQQQEGGIHLHSQTALQEGSVSRCPTLCCPEVTRLMRLGLLPTSPTTGQLVGAAKCPQVPSHCASIEVAVSAVMSAGLHEYARGWENLSSCHVLIPAALTRSANSSTLTNDRKMRCRYLKAPSSLQVG